MVDETDKIDLMDQIDAWLRWIKLMLGLRGFLGFDGISRSMWIMRKSILITDRMVNLKLRWHFL